MPKLTIDGIEIEVEAGTSILQAAEQLGIEIPRFCYHDRLSVPANCRMCLVELEGAPKPVASCAMACGDNMVVKTSSERVKKARSGVMEFLLINHPLDCPICDQGGECDLQDQAYAYGGDGSRYEEAKRAVSGKDISPVIKTFMTRCINCTRCVRFVEEIAGVPVLGQMNRGEDAKIDTFVGRMVESELSGNLVDVCPVGALTSKPYNYKARPWELKKVETIDVMDGLGCNIRVDVRGNEVMRVLPRLHEEINEEWIDDKTRYSYDGLKKNRLDRPYVRDVSSGKLRESSWEEALSVVAGKLKEADKSKIGAMAGNLCDVEAMMALKDFMVSIGCNNIDCRVDGMNILPENRGDYLFNAGIAGIEEADAILLVGTNPRKDAAILNARIRKHWLNKNVPIALIGEYAELNYDYEYLGDNPADLKSFKGARTGFAKIFKDAKNPMLILGSDALTRSDAAAIYGLAREIAGEGFNVLHKVASRVGGLDIGFLPQKDGMNAIDMFEASVSGALDVLYLFGVDEVNLDLMVGRNTFVIYQGHHGDHGAMRADVVLPGVAYTEKEAIYVNTEGRSQLSRKAVCALGDAKEDWKIIRALSEKYGRKLPYDNILQLRERIFADYPFLAEFDVKPDAKMSKIIKNYGEIDKNQKFYSLTPDFYMTNPICRSSKVMAECSNRFVKSKEEIETKISGAAE